MIIIVEILTHKQHNADSASSNHKMQIHKIKPAANIEESKTLKRKINSTESADCDEKVTPTGRNMHSKVAIVTNFEPQTEQQRSTRELPDEESITWDDDRWQVKVLKPFCDCVSSTSYEKDQVQVLQHLKLIIGKAASRISKQGWTAVLSSL